MKLYRKIKYFYHKKNRYIDSYLQDLIARQVNFIPYDIKVLKAKKINSEAFNYFEFTYQGIDYILKDDDLQITIFESK